jgi:predicted ATP-grasp superfamily ATP-dependent carboligase
MIRPDGFPLARRVFVYWERPGLGGACVDLLILGASVRSAAFSSLRIGLRPTCLDLFADADLASVCTVHRVEPDRYPDALAELAADLPPMPWLYTGALENRPDLVDRLSVEHRLLGNSGETLRAVRAPIALAEAVLDAGLVAPRIRIDPAGLPTDGSWLRKPVASAGGRGIGPWVGRNSHHRGTVYYQERVRGLPASAIFVGQRSKVQCLGITRQFVGKGANRFAYRGSLAPWPVSGELLDRVERLGEVVGSRFGLVGLFGIDLILNDGHPWPVEVNPRYTASVEVLEWALGRSLLAEHLQECGFEQAGQGWEPRPETYAAKAIVFTDRAFQWPADWSIGKVDPDEFPEIADIPRPGTTFRPGDPVLTVFARGDSPDECRRALGAQVRKWRKRISSSHQSPLL